MLIYSEVLETNSEALEVVSNLSSYATLRPTEAMLNYSEATFRPTGVMPNYSEATLRPTGAMPDYSEATLRPTGAMPDYSEATFRPTEPMPNYSEATLRPTEAMPDYSEATFRPTGGTYRDSGDNLFITFGRFLHPAEGLLGSWEARYYSYVFLSSTTKNIFLSALFNRRKYLFLLITKYHP